MKLFIFGIILQCIFSGKVKVIETNSKYENALYRNFFSIPNTSMIISANGGEYRALYLAFDDEQPGSGWISVGSQGEEYTNLNTKVKYDSLTNNLLFTFRKTSLINRMIYRSVSLPYGCPNLGYPRTLKVYYRMRNDEGEFEEEEDDFILAESIKSNATNKTVLFTFEKTIKCDQLRLEWNQTSYCDDFYRKRASAAEIKLLAPETENLNENIINAFIDYNRFTLSEKFNNESLIKIIKKELKTLDFNFYPKKFIERIEGVFNGSITFNPKREFTTSSNKTFSNIINQRGDIYTYAKNQLLMSRAGLNRQITGIYGITNKTITVYVSADNKTTPLPCLQFSQFAGDRSFWKGKENCLKIGEQTLTFDDFLIENYTNKVNPGGPIYIINKHTPEQQSKKIKIYIDDGILFPIFKLDDDEEQYIEDLREYIELYNKNKKTYLDITELASDNIMITVKASDAYKMYSEEEKEPQRNLLVWDKHLKKIYSFYGVPLNKNEKNYNVNNKYINIHLRYNQPLSPYAVTEYIGIYDKEWVDKSLYIVGQENDWDFNCHIGDMIDIRETFIFEILNKLTAKYAEVVLKGEENEENDENDKLYKEKIQHLTVDEIENNMRGCSSNDTKLCKGFLQNKRNNYLIFWDLESYSHGFWGKLQNLYRTEYELTSKLTSTERMVYFSSVALGIDLGYYFTRWGLYLEGIRDTIFNEEKASKDYQNLMNQDILEGRIEKNPKKFWYLDNKQYNFMDDIGMGCYEDKEEYDIQIERVSGDNGEYVLRLPNVRCPGHLGFEIYENDKLIGFTYDREYTDKNIYEDDYSPEYYIIAYDRLLFPSEPSEVKSP